MKRFLVPLTLFLIFAMSLNLGCKQESQTENKLSSQISKNALLQDLSSLEFKDIDNKTHSLKKYKGYPVVLIFFSTECPSCLLEAKYLGELYRKEKGSFKVIALNIDIPRSHANILRSYKKELNIDYPIVPISRNVERAWAILNVYTKNDFIPQMFIFDKNGNLRYYATGFTEKVAKKLEETIDKLKKE